MRQKRFRADEPGQLRIDLLPAVAVEENQCRWAKSPKRPSIAASSIVFFVTSILSNFQ
jgi:hypothetical protein